MYNFRYFTQVFPFWLTGYYLWRVTNLIESSAFLIHWLYQKKKYTCWKWWIIWRADYQFIPNVKLVIRRNYGMCLYC